MQTATVQTSRAFGKCRTCGKRTVLEVDGPSQYTAFETLRKSRCACGALYQIKDVDMVRATLSPQTECNTRCTDAMTPNCKCSCNGAHHGENVAEHDRWSGR